MKFNLGNDYEDVILIEHISTLISHIFSIQSCLYLISDDNSISSNIERCVMKGQTPFATLNYEDILENKVEENCFCEGYIVVSSNFTSLERLFANSSSNNGFVFKPHTRVAVFFNGNENFLKKPFSLLAARHAVDIFVIQQFLNIEQFEVTNVYKRKNLKLWNDKNEFALNRNDFQSTTWRPDFTVDTNLKFTAAAFNCTPFVMTDANNVVYDGVEHQILKEITHGWPFVYRIHEDAYDKDMFLELTKDVLNGTSDIAMCSHWMTFSLRRHSDISYPYTQSCTTFLVPKPILMPDVSFVYQPITASVWFVTFASAFLSASTLYASAKHYGRCCEYRYFAVCVLDVLRLLTLNTLKHFPPPKQHVFRIILTTWCIICLVLSNVYSAGFSSVLTYPRFYRHIRTLQDMVDANIRWSETTSVTSDYLASSHQATAIQVAKFFQYETSNEAKLSNLRQNTHGTVVSVLPQGYLVGTNDLDGYSRRHLKVLSECFGFYYFVFPLPKNSPYKQLIQDKIIQFLEHGLVAHWYSEILTKYNLVYMQNFYSLYAEPIPTTHVPFTTSKFKGALFLLVAGLTIASFVFFMEINLFTRLFLNKLWSR